MTLKYDSDKGPGLQDELKRAGQWLREENGKLVSSDNDIVQAIIDSFDPVADLIESVVVKMKAEAQARIFAIMPAWKQTNTLAFGLENTIAFGTDDTKWPADMQAKQQEALAAWGKIKDIRKASDVIEAALRSETDWKALISYDPKADQIWPK